MVESVIIVLAAQLVKSRSAEEIREAARQEGCPVGPHEHPFRVAEKLVRRRLQREEAPHPSPLPLGEGAGE